MYQPNRIKSIICGHNQLPVTTDWQRCTQVSKQRTIAPRLESGRERAHILACNVLCALVVRDSEVGRRQEHRNAVLRSSLCGHSTIIISECLSAEQAAGSWLCLSEVCSVYSECVCVCDRWMCAISGLSECECVCALKGEFLKWPHWQNESTHTETHPCTYTHSTCHLASVD